MQYYKTQDIKQSLVSYLREIGLETPLLEHRTIQAWPAVMGESIARYTREAYIRNGILHVALTSAPLRNNLQMEHKSLANRLNEYVGSQVITDIRFL